MCVHHIFLGCVANSVYGNKALKRTQIYKIMMKVKGEKAVGQRGWDNDRHARDHGV
jgi:hypothetical protein